MKTRIYAAPAVKGLKSNPTRHTTLLRRRINVIDVDSMSHQPRVPSGILDCKKSVKADPKKLASNCTKCGVSQILLTLLIKYLTKIPNQLTRLSRLVLLKRRSNTASWWARHNIIYIYYNVKPQGSNCTIRK